MAAKERQVQQNGSLPEKRTPLQESFPHLTEEEITTIQDLVAQNVQRTLEFGHVIPEELVRKEEAFFLAAIDLMGGTQAFKSFGWEKTWEMFTQARIPIFDKESRTFFDAFPDDQEGARTWYNTHLEAVQSDIIRIVLRYN